MNALFMTGYETCKGKNHEVTKNNNQCSVCFCMRGHKLVAFHFLQPYSAIFLLCVMAKNMVNIGGLNILTCIIIIPLPCHSEGLKTVTIQVDSCLKAIY